MLLKDSIQRLQTTIDALADHDLIADSGLPGWTRAHVLTHLARSADSRTHLLEAARIGAIGCQYPSEDSRARDIEFGARRSAAVIRADLHEALDRFLIAAAEHPADRWDAPGQWLGGGQRPVRGVLGSLRREIEYHHVDLHAGYRPGNWPEDFICSQLLSVTDSMTRRSDAPAVTLTASPCTLQVGDSAASVTVVGEPADLLAWLTGRAAGNRLETIPSGRLPALPSLA